jgi:hypothetical protein
MEGTNVAETNTDRMHQHHTTVQAVPFNYQLALTRQQTRERDEKHNPPFLIWRKLVINSFMRGGRQQRAFFCNHRELRTKTRLKRERGLYA